MNRILTNITHLVDINTNLVLRGLTTTTSRGRTVTNVRSPHRHFSQQSPQTPKHPKLESKLKSSRTPISWKTVGISFGIGGVLLGGMLYVKKEKEAAIEAQKKRSLGKAAIGGDWTLTDHNNKKVSNKDFFGKWILLYFGFTHCPDICPDEIEKMCEVVDTIEKEKARVGVTPIFITVDPDRDDVTAVARYVKEFSPKLIGMTGTAEEIQQATRGYRVYWSQGPKDEDGGYIVDHTIIMYLINPAGEFVDYFGKDKNAEQIANAIQVHMTKYRRK